LYSVTFSCWLAWRARRSRHTHRLIQRMIDDHSCECSMADAGLHSQRALAGHSGMEHRRPVAAWLEAPAPGWTAEPPARGLEASSVAESPYRVRGSCDPRAGRRSPGGCRAHRYRGSEGLGLARREDGQP